MQEIMALLTYIVGLISGFFIGLGWTIWKHNKVFDCTPKVKKDGN